MKNKTINWSGAEAIQGLGLHSHTCDYCGQDFGCEGEHCKPNEKQVCEECEMDGKRENVLNTQPVMLGWRVSD
jgi:hypothetical protein